MNKIVFLKNDFYVQNVVNTLEGGSGKVGDWYLRPLVFSQRFFQWIAGFGECLLRMGEKNIARSAVFWGILSKDKWFIICFIILLLLFLLLFLQNFLANSVQLCASWISKLGECYVTFPNMINHGAMYLPSSCKLPPPVLSSMTFFNHY